ncbi:MAG: EamA family transporter, partial [Burkholderiales bacterium]|nr:EamA family transporter [Burkholderiales bacterium]
MPAPLLIVVASLLFSLMALCVKLASALYGTGEIVMYRGLVGMAVMAVLVRARGGSLRSPVPALHFRRGASGVASLCLWFYSLRGLPIATAMTLNYLSSVWMALLLIGGTLVARRGRVEPQHVLAVLAGFGGVALILRPSFDSHAYVAAAAGLASGLLAAQAYLQVQALGRAGEPELRVVFYFSLG